MTTRTRSRLFASPLSAALVIGSAIVGGAVVYSTAQSARVPAPTPSSVALVDIAKLINGLKELDDRNEMAKVRLDEYSGNLKVTSDEIDSLTNDLKTKIPANDYAARTAAIGKLEELKAVHKARFEIFQHQLNVLKGDTFHLLYDKSIAAIDTFAKKEGFDLVIVDDRAITMPPMGSSTERDVNALANTRRVLFARDGLDVTDRLISWMNTAYAAGGGARGGNEKPATPAPTTPATGGGTTGAPR